MEPKCHSSTTGFRFQPREWILSLKPSSEDLDRLEKVLGFHPCQLCSFRSFVRLLHRPADPSSLAVIRFLFGLMMILDIANERGLAMADVQWGSNDCRFPLFDWLHPLPLQWMYMVYLVMLIGEVGIMFGAFYRLSCILFLIPYWYLILLEKSRWNNHTYLYGLLGFLLLLSDADRAWSVDGLRKPEIRHSYVPLWNYAAIRGQVFQVYFFAGIKKINWDWLGGFSMDNLSVHWVFGIFRFFVTNDVIDLFIVHWGGFFLDLTVGFFMFFDGTRPMAFLFCSLFNLMNSRMFSIGMFPYVMIAVMPIFCYPHWPKSVLPRLPFTVQRALQYSTPPQPSNHCLHEQEKERHSDPCRTPKEEKPIRNSPCNNINFIHKMAALYLCAHFSVQSFLPYSHFLTKGYNTWTQGLYGYSWDMMVHNWKYVHTKVTILDKNRGTQFFLDPEAWTQSWRWVHNADMVKQFAHCIQEKLSRDYNISDIEVYMDVWISLNQRFTQRVYDPTVNILEARWSPFREVTWVLPVLTEASNWRQRLQDIQQTIYTQSEFVEVVFIADFPSYSLVNFVDEDLKNTTLKVLKGTVSVTIFPSRQTNLTEGEKLQIPAGTYHIVTAIRHAPAYYMYLYTNTTHQTLESTWRKSKEPLENQSYPFDESLMTEKEQVYFHLREAHELKQNASVIERVRANILNWHSVLTKSAVMMGRAFKSILTATPMDLPQRSYSTSKQAKEFNLRSR